MGSDFNRAALRHNTSAKHNSAGGTNSHIAADRRRWRDIGHRIDLRSLVIMSQDHGGFSTGSNKSGETEVCRRPTKPSRNSSELRITGFVGSVVSWHRVLDALSGWAYCRRGSS